MIIQRKIRLVFILESKIQVNYFYCNETMKTNWSHKILTYRKWIAIFPEFNAKFLFRITMILTHTKRSAVNKAQQLFRDFKLLLLIKNWICVTSTSRTNFVVTKWNSSNIIIILINPSVFWNPFLLLAISGETNLKKSFWLISEIIENIL